jgi:hypothetical protein
VRVVGLVVIGCQVGHQSARGQQLLALQGGGGTHDSFLRCPDPGVAGEVQWLVAALQRDCAGRAGQSSQEVC